MRLLMVLLVIGIASARGAEIKAGFAERDITPEIGMERPGNYFKNFHTSLHDPCKVRAAVFDDGESVVALVAVDALIIREPQVQAARKGIAERCGIPGEAVLISATHSHSSGPTGMVLPGEYDHADEWVQKLAYEESSSADREYLEVVVEAIVEAVVAAHEGRAEAQLAFASGHEERVTFNRRFRMRNGLMYTTPRQGNPDIVEPAGPIDPEIGVVAVYDLERWKKLKGCIVNFSCHATTSPGGISANYIYYLEQEIRAMMGEDVVVVFLAGASGDVNQTDNRDPKRRVIGADAARLVGGQIGSEAVRAMILAGTTRQVAVAADSKVLKIARRAPDPDRVSLCKRLVAAGKPGGSPINRTDWTFAKEIVLLDAMMEVSPVAEVEIQVVQVGPAVFVTTPAEYFCQFGLEQKAAIDFPFTYPVSLANGCVGYVPVVEAFGPNGGGYETRLTSYSNLVTEAGPLMAKTGIEMANALTPGPVPEVEPLPPFKEAWPYGAVPPELD